MTRWLCVLKSQAARSGFPPNLPDAVDDYVGPDNPVRFIDAFVDRLDLEAAGFMEAGPHENIAVLYTPKTSNGTTDCHYRNRTLMMPNKGPMTWTFHTLCADFENIVTVGISALTQCTHAYENNKSWMTVHTAWAACETSCLI